MMSVDRMGGWMGKQPRRKHRYEARQDKTAGAYIHTYTKREREGESHIDKHTQRERERERERRTDLNSSPEGTAPTCTPSSGPSMRWP